jgi:ubiquinone biosynthesis UbiH/UbiF/VisC/COQ6 family hydroxylase
VEFDIVINGGGLVGASLASALKSSSFKIALVEGQQLPSLDSDWDSRIYAFTPGNVEFLKQIGAWQRLDMTRVQQVEEMRVFGDTGAELDLSAYQAGAPELAFILESRLLQHALWQDLHKQENLTILQPAQCAELKIDEDAAHLTLKDGRTIKTKLIVGADGRDSWVRNQTIMPEVPTPYFQHGVVANFNVAKNHRGIAYQWFTPDGILAYLPLPGRRISIVWSVSPEKSAELLALSPEAFAAQVADAGAHTLGDLEVITPPAAFALRVLNLAHLTKPRLALVGDAAHNIHPLSGHGVNLGLRDAHELAQVLMQRGTTDCGDLALLRRYEAARQKDIMAMQMTTDTLKHLFINDNPMLRIMRNFGLGVTNKLTPLKNMMIRHALQ